MTIDRINRIFIVGMLDCARADRDAGHLAVQYDYEADQGITKQATAVAEGNFDQQVKVQGQDEIGQLGHAFNYMTNRLKEALSSNEEEKEKLASILTNMSDGVIATDDHGRTIVYEPPGEANSAGQ